MTMRKHVKAKKGRAGRSSARSSARSGARSGRKRHKAPRKTPKSAKPGKSRSRLHKPHRKSHAARQPKPSVSAAPSQFRKAADEVPTLEQVIITCANCGRPFKVLKLKGLSLEGTICQRCSLGEMEMPESFG